MELENKALLEQAITEVLEYQRQHAESGYAGTSHHIDLDELEAEPVHLLGWDRQSESGQRRWNFNVEYQGHDLTMMDRWPGDPDRTYAECQCGRVYSGQGYRAGFSGWIRHLRRVGLPIQKWGGVRGWPDNPRPPGPYWRVRYSGYGGGIPMAPPWTKMDATEAADEVAQAIISGLDDDRLKWSKDRTKVQVRSSKVIVRHEVSTPGAVNRSNRWVNALDRRMENTGWTRRGCRSDGEQGHRRPRS